MAEKNPRKPGPRKVSRLGKGLSALMAHPVKVDLPSAPAAQPASPPITPLSSETLENAPINLPATPPSASGSQQEIPTPTIESNAQSHDPSLADNAISRETLRSISIDAIRPNPYQPRQRFDEASLQSLADSISTTGLMQPIVVRRAAVHLSKSGPPSPDLPDLTQPAPYELIAGERRWRAAQLAGLTHIPAIIHQINDPQLAEWSLIENLQRQDLNPIEQAQAFETLRSKFHLSQEDIAQRVGLDRSTVANLLRLLTLCDQVQDWVRQGLLSAGQAKPLASLHDPQLQTTFAQRAMAQALTVRQLERLVQQMISQGQPSDSTAQIPGVPGVRARSAYFADLEAHIAQQLGTKVKIQQGRKKGTGTLSIEFFSLDQFDALLQRLGVSTDY